MTVNYFCVRHKNRRKHNQHFTLLFFKINLHFGTSDCISTYGKLNLLPINSIFWTSLLEKCKDDWCRRPKYTTSFPCCLKRSVSQTLYSSMCKKVFPKCAYHWYNLRQWMFFISYHNCKRYFLHKFIVTQRLGATGMLLCSFKQVFWKNSAFYIHYLHNNNDDANSKGSK